MNRSSVLYLLIAASLAVPGTAFSQWQWKDANGRTVYSDVPPPPSVPDRAIIMRTGPRAGHVSRGGSRCSAERRRTGKGRRPAYATHRRQGRRHQPKDADTEFQERRDA
jgi:hypothetical protein